MTHDPNETLADALSREIVRVSEALSVYSPIPSRGFTDELVRHVITHAAKAIADGDQTEMIRVFPLLNGLKL